MNLGFSKSILLSLFISAQVWAAPLLQTLENDYFYDYEGQRFGIEIEYKNVDLNQSVAIALTLFGGTVSNAKSPDGMEIRILKDTSIGTIKIKVESNQTGEAVTPKSEWVYEVVGSALTFEQNQKLQVFVDELKKAGATGSEDGTPVSIQTNTEIRFGKNAPIGKDGNRIPTDAEIEFEFLVMRNFYNNFDQIMKELSPAEARLVYIQAPSPGMLARMRDPNYEPNAEQILLDYIYRQSLELLGEKDVWEVSDTEIKKRALKRGYPIVERVVKLNAYRFSSILMQRFPNDPFFKQYAEFHWTFPAPMTEQRARNNDFNLLSPIKEIVGLRNATMIYGLFIYTESTSTFIRLHVPADMCMRLFN